MKIQISCRDINNHAGQLTGRIGLSKRSSIMSCKKYLQIAAAGNLAAPLVS